MNKKIISIMVILFVLIIGFVSFNEIDKQNKIKSEQYVVDVTIDLFNSSVSGIKQYIDNKDLDGLTMNLKSLNEAIITLELYSGVDEESKFIPNDDLIEYTKKSINEKTGFENVQQMRITYNELYFKGESDIEKVAKDIINSSENE